MATRNIHFTDEAGNGPVERVHADNLPQGSSFSGSYNDLTDKPTIPAAYTLPAATTSALGGVKKAAAVAKADASGDAAAAITTVNALIDALKASGVLS